MLTSLTPKIITLGSLWEELETVMVKVINNWIWKWQRILKGKKMAFRYNSLDPQIGPNSIYLNKI